ncbi:hypothetical protein [Methanobrevibacter olleyae]|uniref:Uncharacterized protein n=1 Tax=Methanobrevibacter olleyae TaxID=294671 RepID=A0A126QYG0_METOL|nr:hypothetical protein [Methanobrevibacter olleyae]AMK15061.1 hypothetical protein YLM1_0504 [Methanobrevibacter olleyae]
MNNRSKEIIEEAISQGKWIWLEIDNNSNSLYLEFENLKISSQTIFDNSYKGELAIRFGQNIYLALYFNEKEDLSFLKFNIDYLNNLVNSNEYLTEKFPYFYEEFRKDIIKFKFQNHDYLNKIIKEYKNKKVLINNRNLQDVFKKENEDYDFLLSFECEDIAVVVGGDYINCFNDFESLSDDDIKRASNNWMLYYLDYWNKKGTDKEYGEDLLCEEFPLK